MIAELILDRPIVWESFRSILDAFWGLYRKRFAVIHDWGALKSEDSLLEIGCGIGHYASLPCRSYLGIDTNLEYISYASSRHRRAEVPFRGNTTADLLREGSAFDVVLMVDFPHHLPEADCLAVLKDSAHLSKRHVIVFEPVKDQNNPLGQWIVDNDRGHHMRTHSAIIRLLEAAGLGVSLSVPIKIGPILGYGILANSGNSWNLQSSPSQG